MNRRTERIPRAALYGLAIAFAGVVSTAGKSEAAYTFTAPGGYSQTITGFNESAGNALAVNGITAAEAGAGSSFQLYFQSSIGNLIDANGNPVNGPTGQLTVVGSLTETIVSVTTNPDGSVTANFSVSAAQSANSFMNLYYNPTVTTNSLTGAGYNDGTLVLSAKPISSSQGDNNTFKSFPSPTSYTPTGNYPNFDNFQGNDYAGVTSVNGSGGYTVNFAVTQSTVNPAFFPAGNPGVLSLHLFGGTNAPFDQINPSHTFYSITGGDPTTATNNILPNIGLINGVATGTNTDFQFQTNGTITPVPEPTSLALMGLGLGGLLAVIRRRRAVGP